MCGLEKYHIMINNVVHINDAQYRRVQLPQYSPAIYLMIIVYFIQF